MLADVNVWMIVVLWNFIFVTGIISVVVIFSSRGLLAQYSTETCVQGWTGCVVMWWPNRWLGLFAVCCRFIACWQSYPLLSSVHIGKSDSKLTLFLRQDCLLFKQMLECILHHILEHRKFTSYLQCFSLYCKLFWCVKVWHPVVLVEYVMEEIWPVSVHILL